MDVVTAYKTVRRELKAYSPELAGKKEIVALSKCDAVDAEAIAERAEALRKAARKKPLILSAVGGVPASRRRCFAITREIDPRRCRRGRPPTQTRPGRHEHPP